MTASVIALPLARRYALAGGARRLAVRAGIGFAVTLAATAAIDVLDAPAVAITWACACGAAAGALYASALVLVARSVLLEDRMRAMGTVHAAGSAGFALGALAAGTLRSALPGMLVVAVPGIAVLAVTIIAVWFTVPPGGIAPALPLATVRGEARTRQMT
jgi:MFS family permease